MATIYERLALNFDTEKFGDVNDLDEKTIKYYTQFPNRLQDWQYDDLTSGTLTRTDYFRNPVANISLTLKDSMANLINVSANVQFSNSPVTGNLIYTTSVSTYDEITPFISHTNNVSGVSAQSMSVPNVPSYDLIVSVGNEIMRIVVSEEQILNASPFLGNFTSLFIEPDLIELNDILIIDTGIVANSITTITIEEEPYFMMISNLSSSQINTIYTHVDTAYNLIYGRRMEDWAYYQRSRQILDDYMMVNRFNFIGNTQKTLINDFIGTERLKTNLANT